MISFGLSVGKFGQSRQIRDDTRREFVAKTVPAKVLDNFLTCLRGMGRCFLNHVQSLEEFFRLRSIFFVEVDHVIELLDTAKMALSTCEGRMVQQIDQRTFQNAFLATFLRRPS